MYDDMAAKMASVITAYSQPISPGDRVLISGNTHTAPLVEALYEAIIRRGGHPIPLVGLPGLNEIKLMLANDEQLQFTNPAMLALLDEIDVYLSIFGSGNTKGLAQIDPQRLTLVQKAQQPVLEKYFSKVASGELRWCILPWPTTADAQEAERGLHAYRQFVYEACALHLDDPVAYWTEVRDRQEKLVTYLNDKNRLEIKGPGIEMSLEFGGRLWVSAYGDNNFPDGEIFTGPIEDSVNGHVAFNLRSVYGGREVRGVKLTFKDGKVIEASAEKGEDYLMSQLDMDEGARFLGEFAIGTNWNIQEVTGSTLFDEKIGGSIHMALGRSIPETKGENFSNIHWDMVHDVKQDSTIHIDGELFYKDGHFVIDL